MSQNTAQTAKQRAFLQAQTHSRRVRFVKRALPFVAIMALVAVGSTVLASRVVPDLAINLPASTIQDGKLVMANPNMDGFTSDNRPFRVTATRAIQDLKAQEAMELEELSADVELKDGKSARLTSPTGVFDSNANTLLLPNQAVLTLSDGVRAIMGQADIDIRAGTVVATKSVEVINPESQITAKAMQIEDGGQRILFEQDVQLVIKPKADNNVVDQN